jgi:uncharacterized damage-inducible protein DinB
MTSLPITEYWLSGPVEDIPALLQPIAHTLLQVKYEAEQSVIGFPEEKLWERPAGLASVGFHLQHLAGVMDRLITYAKAEQLTQQQFDYLAAEGKENKNISIRHLLSHLQQQVDKSIEQLKTINPSSLTEQREVGRKKVPSTVIGLLFHAAEHSMRHMGQLLVTCKVLINGV